MKKLLAVLAVLAVVSVSSKAFAADGTINLTNYDSNNPIFFNNTSTRLPIAGSFAQMLGGPAGGTLVVLANGTAVSTFTLAEPGFFDGGFGVVPGVAESGSGSFKIRAWRTAATFDTATEKGESAVYSNAVGTNPSLPNLPAPAANTGAPSFTVTGVVPEPSTVLLGLLGASALLFRRRK